MQINGADYHAGYWSPEQQQAVLTALRPVLQAAPFFKPRMPRTNQPWSIMMSNAGETGWVSDVDGYRYQPTHPETGTSWPPIPDLLLQAWRDLTDYPAPPECCLINYYQGEKAKMGLHQDRDETDLTAPVLSFSLGDSAVFRVGGQTRRGATRSVKLHSGDAIILGGTARLSYHGIDRILPGSSQMLVPDFPEGGRLNLTLRRVSKA